MSRASSIWDLKDPLGRQRYYPPGAHPALADVNAHLTELRDLKARGATSEIDQAIEWAEQTIAQFEQVESEAKARDDLGMRGRRG